MLSDLDRLEEEEEEEEEEEKTFSILQQQIWIKYNLNHTKMKQDKMARISPSTYATDYLQFSSEELRSRGPCLLQTWLTYF
jgi:hypothetical protein